MFLPDRVVYTYKDMTKVVSFTSDIIYSERTRTQVTKFNVVVLLCIINFYKNNIEVLS